MTIMEDLKLTHDRMVAEAASKGCLEWCGPNPDSKEVNGIIFGAPLKRCGAQALAGSERCATHEAMFNDGYRPCFACGEKQSFVNDESWAAFPVPARHHNGKPDWYVVGVTSCCRKRTNTEILATFSGYLQNAKDNALNTCRLHNEQIPIQRANWEKLRSIADLNERVRTAMARRDAAEKANQECDLSAKTQQRIKSESNRQVKA